MEQTLLKIALPAGAAVWPADFRTIAAGLDAPDPAFFAREASGATTQYPGVRFLGGRRWAGVLADAEHEPVLMRQAGRAIKALGERLGQPLPAEFQTHTLEIVRSQYPIAYRVSNMALKRRHPSARARRLEELAAERIQGSLQRTCAHYQMDCPSPEELEMLDVQVERHVGMRLRAHGVDTNEFVTVANVSFSVFAELKGYWFAGNLTARGHGRIVRLAGNSAGSMNRGVSPSQLAVEAAGLPANGLLPAVADGFCAMCGHANAKGDKVVPFSPAGSFTDYSALRHPGSGHICRWCDAVWNRDFTQTYLKTIICEEGIFPAASNDNLAYWLMNPPTGEWLFLQGDQKVQHLVWRTPVNTSRDVFQVRSGETVMTIRRSKLQAGAEAARELAAAATVLRGASRGAPFKSPFMSLSRDADSLSQGYLRNELLAAARTDDRVRRLCATISALTAGELWGLTSVLYAANPHKPQLVTKKEASQ